MNKIELLEIFEEASKIIENEKVLGYKKALEVLSSWRKNLNNIDDSVIEKILSIDDLK